MGCQAGALGCHAGVLGCQADVLGCHTGVLGCQAGVLGCQADVLRCLGWCLGVSGLVFFGVTLTASLLLHSSGERSDRALGTGLCGEGGQHQREDLHHPGGRHAGATVLG